MSIMIDLPPAMAQEAQGYANVQGTTLEQMFLDYLAAELTRKRKADAAMSRLDALAKKTGGRLRGDAYVFNRADAYEPETPSA